MNTSLNLQRVAHGDRIAPRRLHKVAAPATRGRALEGTPRLPAPSLLPRVGSALGLCAIAALLLALGVPLPALPLLSGGLLIVLLLIAGLRLD